MRSSTAAKTISLIFLLACVFSPAPARPTGGRPRRSIPTQPNPVSAHLFRRQAAYPPADVHGPAPKPEWTAAYQAARGAGLIPSFAPSVLTGGAPVYSGPNASTVQSVTGICSWTLGQCDPEDDIVDAPDGMSGLTFDDGPQQPTATLLPFLRQNNQKATHFMIGSRILDNMALFTQAVETNENHIAVHTWSHPYMTTMTDSQVLGELGWTMQIIYDQSGYLPAFWRPPYGDVDNRVRAIAKHVFGLTTVIWSHDTDDWCLTDASGQGSSCAPGSGPQNLQNLLTELSGWYQGPKSPGMIILEHELATRAVQGFIQTYPLMKSQGWDLRTIPDLWGLDWYQNADGGNVTGSPVSNVLAQPSETPNITSSALPTSTAASTSGNASYTIALASASAGPSSESRTASGACGRWTPPAGLSAAVALCLGLLATGF